MSREDHQDDYTHHRRRRRFRSWRRYRLVLLLLGASALVMGIGLLVFAPTSPPVLYARLRRLGLLYLITGSAILMVRVLVHLADRFRKRKYRRT